MDTSGLALPKDSDRATYLPDAKCRQAVWDREDGRDRFTGQPLSKTDPDPAFRGEVHHLAGRNVRPEWRNDPARQTLLSVVHHRWATGVWGGKLLKLLDPDDPTMPATDARKKILFVRVDSKGVELWRVIR